MLRGWLDELTSSGHVVGWAVDPDALDRPVEISIRDPDGQEVAWGLAHRYREDLALAGLGTGWCAFRVRLSVPPQTLRAGKLLLAARACGTMLHVADPVVYVEGAEPGIAAVEALVATDPTVIGDISELRGCETLFTAYIKARGVTAFVRATYVYVLGRPADPHGLALYGGLIRKALLGAYELLATLAESEEFRARPRSLAAPNTPVFPFHTT